MKRGGLRRGERPKPGARGAGFDRQLPEKKKRKIWGGLPKEGSKETSNTMVRRGRLELVRNSRRNQGRGEEEKEDFVEGWAMKDGRPLEALS